MLASNSQSSACLCLPIAGTKGVHQLASIAGLFMLLLENELRPYACIASIYQVSYFPSPFLDIFQFLLFVSNNIFLMMFSSPPSSSKSFPPPYPPTFMFFLFVYVSLLLSKNKNWKKQKIKTNKHESNKTGGKKAKTKQMKQKV